MAAGAPAPQRRLCGVCRLPGHTKRKCKFSEDDPPVGFQRRISVPESNTGGTTWKWLSKKMFSRMSTLLCFNVPAKLPGDIFVLEALVNDEELKEHFTQLGRDKYQIQTLEGVRAWCRFELHHQRGWGNVKQTSSKELLIILPPLTFRISNTAGWGTQIVVTYAWCCLNNSAQVRFPMVKRDSNRGRPKKDGSKAQKNADKVSKHWPPHIVDGDGDDVSLDALKLECAQIPQQWHEAKGYNSFRRRLLEILYPQLENKWWADHDSDEDTSSHGAEWE